MRTILADLVKIEISGMLQYRVIKNRVLPDIDAFFASQRVGKLCFMGESLAPEVMALPLDDPAGGVFGPYQLTRKPSRIQCMVVD